MWEIWLIVLSAVIGPICLAVVNSFLKKSGGKMDEKFTQVLVMIKRLELLNLIQHDPKNRMAINKCYDEYRGLGGNSYIHQVYDTWKEDYGEIEFK